MAAAYKFKKGNFELGTIEQSLNEDKNDRRT